MARTQQGLSYEICSTDITKIFITHIINSSFWDMRHYSIHQQHVVILRGLVRFVYTRLMSHNTASIASMLKIRLGLDS